MMKSITSKIMACVVLLSVFATFAAEDAVDPEVARKNEVKFKRADVDEDGFLTLEEFQALAKNKERAIYYFNRKDLDQDGRLTFVEYCEYHIKRK